MKISFFDCFVSIGDSVLYRGRVMVVCDIDRRSHRALLDEKKWVRCSEFELYRVKDMEKFGDRLKKHNFGL